MFISNDFYSGGLIFEFSPDNRLYLISIFVVSLYV